MLLELSQGKQSYLTTFNADASKRCLYMTPYARITMLNLFTMENLFNLFGETPCRQGPMGNIGDQNPMKTMVTPQQLTAGYAEMADRFESEGWTPSLLTLMFRQLRGSPTAVARQMEREAERVHARFLVRCRRYPRSWRSFGRLPVWIGCPDYPVFKHAKQNLQDVAVNDGCHLHAVNLQPPRTRLKTTVDEHFETEQHLYVRPDFPLLRIHAVPVTHDLADVVDYALKAMRRGLVGDDSILLLPRSLSELPSA